MTRPESGARRPATVRALIAALGFQGLSGLAGGLGLVGDPTGAALGLRLEWLDGSPFADYLIPGVFLLTVLGAAPLLTAHGVWRSRAWSWAASLLVGLSLLVWLGIQIAVVGYVADPPLQLVYGLLGVLIVVLAARPAVRKDLRRPHG